MGGAAILLGIVCAALLLLWGPRPVLLELFWYAPLMYGLVGLAAMCVSLLAIGQYPTFRAPALYWVATGLAAATILSVFFILTSPGLGPGGQALIARLANTSTWIALTQLTVLSLALLAAVLIEWPGEKLRAGRWWLYSVAAWLVLVILGGSVLVGLERYLPALTGPAANPSPFLLAWNGVLVLLFAAGVVLSTRRYLLTGERPFAHTALAQVALALVALTGLVAAQRHDLAYYLGPALLVGAFLILMFGQLSELVARLRGEQDKAREAQASAEALRESEAKYRGLTDSIADAFFAADQDLNCTFWNKACEELTGISSREALGKSLLEALPEPADRARTGEFYRTVLGTRQPRTMLNAYRLRERDYFLEMTAYPTAYGLVVFARDVTERVRVEAEMRRLNVGLRYRAQRFEGANEKLRIANENLENEIAERKRAEDALRRREAVLAQAGQMAHLGAWEIEFRDPQDPSANSLTWSDEVYRIFGYDPAEVAITNELLTERVHPDDRPRIASTIEQAIASKRPSNVEYRIVRPDGTERIVREHGEITFDDEGKPIRMVGSVQDITEQVRAKESLQKAMRLVEHLNQELGREAAQVHAASDHLSDLLAREQSVRGELEATNKELEAFVYSVSHDLRAPLNLIGEFSRMMLEDYGRELPEESLELMRLIRENAAATIRLVEDLLALSRTSRLALKKENVEMQDLVRQVWEDLVGAEDGRQIEIKWGPLPAASADPILIKQVWVNLISNALKFTRPRPVAHIEIGSDEKEGETVYYIKDDGVGFDGTDTERLFRAFQRLHHPDEFEGTGVGLAIVERIVRRHGGSVCAEGAVDQGAAFYFTLGKEP